MGKRLILVVALVLLMIIFSRIEKSQIKQTSFSYVPLGDSFTIGLGVEQGERLPNLITESLAKDGIEITILDNPAVAGYTVREAINYQLPVLMTLKPDFLTVFIGTNDSFAQVGVEFFEKDYQELLDKTQKLLKDPKKMVLITIPDYSQFPALKSYQVANLPEMIGLYNNVIKREARVRGLIVADIFEVSQKMNNEAYFIPDGLHPSKAGYIEWERVISPKVRELLFN